MTVIVAKLTPVDEDSEAIVATVVYLAAAPFPGDIIAADDQKIRVIRRTFIDHGGLWLSVSGKPRSDQIDLELDVRLVGEHDG